MFRSFPLPYINYSRREAGPGITHSRKVGFGKLGQQGSGCSRTLMGEGGLPASTFSCCTDSGVTSNLCVWGSSVHLMSKRSLCGKLLFSAFSRKRAKLLSARPENLVRPLRGCTCRGVKPLPNIAKSLVLVLFHRHISQMGKNTLHHIFGRRSRPETNHGPA